MGEFEMDVKTARKILYVTGVIGVIIGCIGLAAGLIIIVGATFASESADSSVSVFIGAAAVAVTALILMLSVWCLILGIMGILTKKDAGKALVCFILGVVTLAVQAAFVAISLLDGVFNFGYIFLMILPALYTYSAYIVKSRN